MAEHIEREAAVAIADYAADEHPYDKDPERPETYSDYNQGWNDACDYIRGKLEAMPVADVAQVRHGRWLFVTKGQMTSAWCCSECGRTVVITCDEELRKSKLEKEYPFCNCGAMMDLEV